MAFVELRDGAQVSTDELNAYCLSKIAKFKVPKHYVFEELPKTSTGKIQKFMLRKRAKEVLSA